jgi:iron complex transport system substrate-binding protein
MFAGGIRRALGACLAWLATGLVATAAAAPVRVTDDLGRQLQWDEPPRRIVTLLPSLTESVCALGACDRLVGVDRYSSWPPQVARLPRLGDLEDAQLEAVLAVRPDVVILSPSSRVQERLAALGLKVLVLDTRTQEDMRHVFMVLGTLLAHPDPLSAWRAIDAGLAQVAAGVPAAMRGRSVYFEIDSAPYAAGASSFIGETLGRLGLRNIVGAELGPFPKLNPEAIVRADPQVIMIGRRDAAGLAARPGWGGVRALKSNAVCAFDEAQMDVIVRPGPRIVEGAAAMARCLGDLAARETAAPAASRTAP